MMRAAISTANPAPKSPRDDHRRLRVMVATHFTDKFCQAFRVVECAVSLALRSFGFAEAEQIDRDHAVAVGERRIHF